MLTNRSSRLSVAAEGLHEEVSVLSYVLGKPEGVALAELAPLLYEGLLTESEEAKALEAIKVLVRAGYLCVKREQVMPRRNLRSLANPPHRRCRGLFHRA